MNILYYFLFGAYESDKFNYFAIHLEINFKTDEIFLLQTTNNDLLLPIHQIISIFWDFISRKIFRLNSKINCIPCQLCFSEHNYVKIAQGSL